MIVNMWMLISLGMWAIGALHTLDLLDEVAEQSGEESPASWVDIAIAAAWPVTLLLAYIEGRRG